MFSFKKFFRRKKVKPILASVLHKYPSHFTPTVTASAKLKQKIFLSTACIERFPPESSNPKAGDLVRERFTTI
jgi:hypothetical protein